MPAHDYFPQTGGAGFLTTRWSVILKAAEGQASPGSRQALENLCRAYWQPLYFFARRQGCLPEAAEDVTQELFARLTGQDLLERVSPDRGRFRSWLLGVLKNIMAQVRDRERTARRGGGIAPLSLDAMEAEDRYRLCPADAESPEVAFDRQWAQTVMARAVERLAEEYRSAGYADRWEVLKDFLITGSGESTGASAAAALGLSDTALRSAVFKLRQRFSAALRAEVADTVSTEEEVEEELRHLARMLVP